MNLPAGHKTMCIALRWRFWVETILGSASALLAILTTFWHDWIESVFRVDPDHGNGGLEWAIVAVLAICAVVLFALARFEWRFAARRPALDVG